MAQAWEVSAAHRTVSHDQVSALLIVLPIPEGSAARHLTDVTQFLDTAGTRHHILPDQAFANIIPSASDQQAFCANIVVHVAQILSEETHNFC